MLVVSTNKCFIRDADVNESRGGAVHTFGEHIYNYNNFPN